MYSVPCVSLQNNFLPQASPVDAKPASAGESPLESELEMLRQQVQALQLANDAKDTENRNLHSQLAAAHEQLQAAQELPGPDGSMKDELDEVSEGGLRKRLQRLCERKKNGCLAYIMWTGNLVFLTL